MNDAPLLIIAAGGTGGHMFPAQALAEEMLTRGWRVKLSTDERGNKYSGGFPAGIEREIVSSATFSRGGIATKLAAPFKILGGAFSAWRGMRADRPSAVIGFGGYPALPAMISARLLNTPRLVHEQNGVLGRVNKVFAPHVHMVACSVWPTRLPTKAKATHTGNPVRGAVLERANATYQAPGLWPMNLLVIGGSQGASVMSRVVPEAIAMLPEGMLPYLTISHQARDADMDLAIRSYEAIGVRADVQPFFDDIPARLAETQLVISRAGASSVADIAVIGRPSILIPYPAAINDHQTANAQGLLECGGAFVLQESTLTPEALSGHISGILSDEDGARAMAQAAATQGKPRATQELADLVEKLTHN